MKINGVFIDSLGVHLPEWVASAEAEGASDYARGEFAAAGLKGTHVAGDVPAADMAVLAARSAVTRSSAHLEAIDYHVHGSVYYQVPEGAYAPAYVLRELGAGEIPSLDVQQGCNSMLGGLEAAIGQITGVAKRNNVLITTATNFSTPLINRWGDFGTSSIFSDGAVAAVVNGRSGFAEVRSLTSGTLHSLEQWHRGEESLLPPDGGDRKYFNMGERSQYFVDNVMGFAELFEKFGKFDLGIINEAIVDAGLTSEEISKVISINVDKRMTEHALMRPLGIPMDRLVWEYGSSVGHAGGADIFITLEHAVRTGELVPGDHVLMTSQGPGWVCSATVLTIGELPAW
ncbi:ketoacyl-ACP synthase III family protein [Streptomyces sp. NPDC098789]|uniref:ketoacyl-ACP synthase III family protein n=1 Tax=Streptomyces sp. NPDC098789 TaxID=3366098 RepID=UPI003806BE34